MKKNYDLFILGATAAALGVAEANPELNIVILEEGLTTAPEFSASLKLSPTPFLNNQLLDEIKERGAENGTIWQPAIAPITARRYKSLGNADVYFFAALTSIDWTDNLYTVTFSSYGIPHSFTAKKLLDTTSKQLSAPYIGVKDSFSERLNYLVTGISDGERPEFRTIDCQSGIANARISALAAAKKECRRVLFTASEPEYVFTSQGNGVLFHSAFFSDPASAYEAGSKLDTTSLPTPAAETPNPIDDGEYDIIVAGLGTAGAIAAMVASAAGLKVLGIDMLEMQGGSGTAGGILSYYYGFKGGVYRDVDEEAVAIDTAAPGNQLGILNKVIVLDERTAAIDRRCAIITGALHDKNKISGIRFSEKGALHEARAKFVIDCTAESIVCVSAGLAMQGGRDFDGGLQPYSSVRLSTDFKRIGYGYIDNGRTNPYDPDIFSQSVLESASSYIHLKNNYSDLKYLGIAPLIGLREGLRPIGEENVSFPDIVDGNFTREPVCYGLSNLDNHGKDSVFEDRAYQDFITICGLWGYGFSIPLPVGALIPKDSDGILVAGRGVAVSHDIAMGMRMKDDCQKTGEAAARLAILAIRNGVRAKEVDTDLLRAELKASGCLGQTDRMLLEKQRSDEKYEYPFWCTDHEKLKAGFASDAPGYFIWSAKELADTDFLADLLESEDSNIRWHAALALAITDAELPDNVSGLLEQVLLESAQSRDGFVPKTGRKYMNLRAVSAISALTRLALKERLPNPESAYETLAAILEHTAEISEDLPFEPHDLMTDREDLRFQYESHLTAAIAEIGRRHAALQEKTDQTLTEFFAKAANENRKIEVSLMGTNGFKLDCTEALRKLTLG